MQINGEGGVSLSPLGHWLGAFPRRGSYCCPPPRFRWQPKDSHIGERRIDIGIYARKES
ncbi:hypothetical protein AMTR_s00019p00247120 [Amborella trichopoda]|uniref:Uncharacterized protein n=1 Tax=Amborella trichopoda TaxID=13333 RepID=W1PHG8_AMBTC|nr:hypothetical protein AMTR_s00019p00247120 [Amborella trichopoda]